MEYLLHFYPALHTRTLHVIPIPSRMAVGEEGMFLQSHHLPAWYCWKPWWRTYVWCDPRLDGGATGEKGPCPLLPHHHPDPHLACGPTISWPVQDCPPPPLWEGPTWLIWETAESWCKLGGWGGKLSRATLFPCYHPTPQGGRGGNITAPTTPSPQKSRMHPCYCA